MDNNLGSRRIKVIRMCDFLAIGMPASPDDPLAAVIEDDVLRALKHHGSKVLLLDGSLLARTVSATAQTLSLMGDRTINVGIRSTVAITPTQIGLTLGNLETALNVGRGLQLTTDPIPRNGMKTIDERDYGSGFRW